MAQICFFLIIQESEHESLPEIIELPATPQCAGDGGDRPHMSTPYVLGRSSPCLTWALKNSLVCSRRLLEFTTWTFPRGLLAAPAAGSTTAVATSYPAIHAAPAHPSMPHCGVRVHRSDRNRIVRVQRRRELSPDPHEGKKNHVTHSNVVEGVDARREVGGRHGHDVLWLQVGDSLNVANKVVLHLGALKLIPVPPDPNLGPVPTATDAPHSCAAEPLCWFAGSDMGSGSSDGSRHSQSPSATTTTARPSPPPLPQVGIRPWIAWETLPKVTRHEMMLTCWARLSASTPSLESSFASSQPPSRSPCAVSTSVPRSATAASVRLEKGVQTTNPFAGGTVDLALLETHSALSGSSRSSVVAGSDGSRDGGGSGCTDIDEIAAATPSHSQVEATAPRGKDLDSGWSRRRAGERQSGAHSQPSHVPQHSLGSSPPSPLSGTERSEKRRTTARTTGPSPPEVHEEEEEEKLTAGSGSLYTAGETYDARLDDALAALEKHAVHAEPLTPHPLPTTLLGEEEEDEAQETVDSDLGASGNSKRSSAAGRRGAKRPRAHSGGCTSTPSPDGPRSASGTPRRSRKSATRGPQTLRSGSTVDARQTSRAPFLEPGVLRSTSRGERRSASAYLMSGGLPTLPPATNNDAMGATATTGGTRVTGHAPRQDRPFAGDESQEVFFQH